MTPMSPQKAVQVFAPAKVNLCLHITGQREDGYHLIDSLVSFGTMGDSLHVHPAGTLSLTIEGPEGHGLPSDMSNLVLKAAALFAGADGFAFTLDKHLPTASGIGGGSADAAAAARAVLALQEAGGGSPAELSDDHLAGISSKLLALGADIPMCLLSKPARVQGIGEKVSFEPLGPLPVVLVNPRVPVSTPEVFKALEVKDNPPLPLDMPRFANATACIEWLSHQRNDLEEPALAVAPVIGSVLKAIAAQQSCGLARMSGSGATCFGLFPTDAAAYAAAERLHHDFPGWWVAGGRLADQSQAALPLFN